MTHSDAVAGCPCLTHLASCLMLTYVLLLRLCSHLTVESLPHKKQNIWDVVSCFSRGHLAPFPIFAVSHLVFCAPVLFSGNVFCSACCRGSILYTGLPAMFSHIAHEMTSPKVYCGAHVVPLRVSEVPPPRYCGAQSTRRIWRYAKFFSSTAGTHRLCLQLLNWAWIQAEMQVAEFTPC